MLAQIKKFCENNPDIIVVATGDTSQLPPIVDYTNTKIYKEYADECINLIFPYEIYLTENKRLKTEKDRKKLKQLKEDNEKRINALKHEIEKLANKILEEKSTFLFNEIVIARSFFFHS
jgi:hypothetical protein